MGSKRWVLGIVALGIGLGLVSPALSADKYVTDTDHTLVGFVVKHLVITNVRGKFNEFTGVIIFDEKDVTKSSMSGTIKVASIDTDNEKRDQHLRSADFFDAEKHPEIVFQSKRIEKQGEGYMLHGDLTMRGVTKTVTMPFNITGKVTHAGKTRLGFEAELEVNRHDYQISYNKTMDTGGLVVGNRVKIEIIGEAIKEG
jgi:polyisoprenoid-binding protein YceI